MAKSKKKTKCPTRKCPKTKMICKPRKPLYPNSPVNKHALFLKKYIQDKYKKRQKTGPKSLQSMVLERYGRLVKPAIKDLEMRQPKMKTFGGKPVISLDEL